MRRTSVVAKYAPHPTTDPPQIAMLVEREYNEPMATSLKRRMLRAGSWHVIKRATKLIPVVGSIFAVALAGYEIKKKGLVPGMAHVGLDVIPVVGATKNVIEIFTGDWIPDKKASAPNGESARGPGAETSSDISDRPNPQNEILPSTMTKRSDM